MGPAIQVGRWTPLVTCVIGTSSTERVGNMVCHIDRATVPCT